MAAVLRHPEAGVTRLRAGLEGRWRRMGSLEPSFEIGVRQDGGDAETGFGADIGGGLTCGASLRWGIETEVSMRAVCSRTRTAASRSVASAGSFAWDPDPASDLGPSLTLRQTVGASATGGVDALLRRDSAQRLLAVNDDDEEDDLGTRRLEAEFGYGLLHIRRALHDDACGWLRADGGGARSEPQLASGGSEAPGPGVRPRRGGGAARASDGRRGSRAPLRDGPRLAAGGRAARRCVAFEVRLEGARSDVANDDAGPKSLIGARLMTRW